MSLFCDIATFLEGKVCEQVQADLEDMVVHDFALPRSNVALRTILLCESPHVDEVLNGYALAGRSGRRVTAALRHMPDVCQDVAAIDGEHAIGCLLRGPTRHSVLDSLGFMNVSTLPLQKTPYCQHIQQDGDYGDLLFAFGEIKGRAQGGIHGLNFRPPANVGRSRATLMQEMPKVILRDLRGRLCELPNGVMVIPCGHIARNFLRRVESEAGRRWSHPLPAALRSLRHPFRWPRTYASNLPQWLRSLLSLICTRATQ